MRKSTPLPFPPGLQDFPPRPFENYEDHSVANEVSSLPFSRDQFAPRVLSFLGEDHRVSAVKYLSAAVPKRATRREKD